MAVLVRSLLLLSLLGVVVAPMPETITQISISNSTSSSSNHVITADSPLKDGPMIGVTRKARRPVYPVITNYRENNRTLWSEALFPSALRSTEINTPTFTKRVTKHLAEQATEKMTDVTEQMTEIITNASPSEEEIDETINSEENNENIEEGDMEYSDENISGGEDLEEQDNGEINDVIRTSTSKITFSPLRFITNKRKPIALRPFQLSTKVMTSTNVITDPPETTITIIEKIEDRPEEKSAPNEVDTKSTAKALPPTISNRVLFPQRFVTGSPNSVLKMLPRRNKIVVNDEITSESPTSTDVSATHRLKLGAQTMAFSVDDNTEKTTKMESTTVRHLQRFRLLTRAPKKMKTTITTTLPTTTDEPSTTSEAATEPSTELIIDASEGETTKWFSTEQEDGLTHVTSFMESETPQEKSYDQPSEDVNEYAVEAVQEHWPQAQETVDYFGKEAAEAAYLRK